MLAVKSSLVHPAYKTEYHQDGSVGSNVCMIE